MNDVGRPLKDIDAEQVYKLARMGCTQQEIAEFFGCTQSVISDRFSMDYLRARGDWKQSLRRAQTIRAVKDRSDSMLIHLGKVYLGQADVTEVVTREDVIQKAQARALERKRQRESGGDSS